MKPVYIRFVVPPNKDVQLKNTLPNVTSVKSPRLLTLNQNNFPSFQMLNGVSSTITMNQCHATNDTSPSTVNLFQKIIQPKINNSKTIPPVHQSSDSIVSCINTSTVESNDTENISKIHKSKYISLKIT
jgi:hypothetical protein